MVPRARNLILAVIVRKGIATRPLDCQRVAHGVQAGEAGVLEAVPLAGGHVAALGTLAALAGVVGHALAAAVVAGFAGLEGRVAAVVAAGQRRVPGVGGGGVGLA